MHDVPVIAVIRQVHFWPDEQQAAVKNEEPAVVSHTAVNDWHTNVTHNAVCGVSLQQLCDHFPGVLHRVCLNEVVLTAITWNFQLWSYLQLMKFGFLEDNRSKIFVTGVPDQACIPGILLPAVLR